MTEARTERVYTRPGLQRPQDIVQYQRHLRLILLLVAGLPLHQVIDHLVRVVVFAVKVLLHEATCLIVIYCVGNDEHVIEVLVTIKALVEQQVGDDGALARLDRADHEHAGRRLRQVRVQGFDLV